MARFKTGVVTLTGPAQQIRPADTIEFSQYKLKALSTNVSNIALGDSTVTASAGYMLEPGDSELYDYSIGANHPIADAGLDQWYVAGTAGDKLTWLALVH